MAEKVGFVGLGVMGTPICRRLLAAGYPLAVYHYRPEKAAPLVALGAEAASSPAELARGCSKVIVMLKYSSSVEQVVLGPSGILEGIDPGAILLDMGSSIPSSTRRISAALAEKGVEMVDAPVAGGPEGCERGSLTIMVGGKEEIYRACLPILQVMGKKIYHVGPIGCGHTIKTVNNMMLAINLQGVCEGLVLGVKAGIPAETIFEVVANSSGASYALTNRAAPHILTNDFQPPSLDNLAKDVDIATSLGRELKVPLVAANLVHQILMTAQGRGMSDMDDTCIVKLVEEAAGVRVKPE